MPEPQQVSDIREHVQKRIDNAGGITETTWDDRTILRLCDEVERLHFSLEEIATGHSDTERLFPYSARELRDIARDGLAGKETA